MNGDFDENIYYYNEDHFNHKKKPFLIYKILGFVLIFLLLILIVYLFFIKNKYDYSLKFSYPEIVYVGENATINMSINGSDKYVDGLMTTFDIYSDEIISLSENELFGKEGNIYIEPIKEGVETIHIISIVQNKHSEGGKVIESKDIVITVCPSFSSNIFPNNIIVNKNNIYNMNINFGDEKCKKRITYLSSNNNIMVVDNDGVITGIKSGMAKLIVSNGSKSFEVPVIVK